MKYTEIIKNSKFYIPMNLNLGYLLTDTQTVLLMTIIHCSELNIKVRVPQLAQFTARSDSTIDRALKALRNLRLVSDDNKPCLKQIELVYNAVNNAKSIKDRKAWCEAYKKSKGQIEPMKEGQNEPTKEAQFEPTYKEDINNKDFNKEDILEYNTNILKENKELEEALAENQNESKSEIESSSDSNPFQPIVNNQLSPRENEEVETAFRTLEFCKPSIDTNTLKNCLDLLHEVSQSNRETYMDSLSKAHSRFKLLLADYTKEEAKPFTKTLNELSSVLGEAFRKNDTKQK